MSAIGNAPKINIKLRYSNKEKYFYKEIFLNLKDFIFYKIISG